MRAAIAVSALSAALLGATPPIDSARQGVKDTRVVTVLLTYEETPSQTSFASLHERLSALLHRDGWQLDLREQSPGDAHEEFANLYLFKMKGRCSMQGQSPVLPIGALSDERGALAMTFSSNGQILPFGAVECDRVRESLERIVGRGRPHQFEGAYGSALGLVMAHELYHMMSRSSEHTHGGLTKEKLSSRELLDADLVLPSDLRSTAHQERSSGRR